MWIRSELKARAKQVLHGCFWSAIIVCLISGILAGEYANSSNSESSYSITEMTDDILNQDIDSGSAVSNAGQYIAGLLTSGLFTLFIAFGIVISLIWLAIRILIGYPIQVGAKRFFMSSRQQHTSIRALLYGFRSGNVVNIVIVQLLMAVKTFLWSLLLVIPGIVKGYEYMMIPYILAENPDMDQRRAFELSRAMMEGEKWNAFLLDLSFLPWLLLGAITFQIANVFYVNPYMAATHAELYAVLREGVLRQGQATSYELPGFMAED